MDDRGELSIRIVHIDSYQQSLHSHTTALPFQAAHLSTITPTPTLPTIRIFGTTPAGQSCCLHLHGIRPYLHIPLPPNLPPADLLSHTAALRTALESALHTAFPPPNPSVDTQPIPFLADVSPVPCTSIYGFASLPAPFLKISAFSPATIPRLATLISQNALPKTLLPRNTAVHSAHIPYISQFLIDNSLSPMSHITLSALRFRHPLPTLPDQPLAAYNRPLPTRIFSHGLHPHVPHLFWPFSVPRRSTAPLELDSFAHHIIPPEAPPPEYRFLSRSLHLLWAEERLRRGAYPPRELHPIRKVAPGPALSHPDLRHRLSTLLLPNQPHVSTQDEPRCTPDEFLSAFAASQSTHTQPASSPTLPQSYDDVLQILDAPPSLPDQPPLQQTDPVDEPPHQPPDDDDHSDHWADIIACTQHISDSSKSPSRPKRPRTEHTPHPAPVQPRVTTHLHVQQPHFALPDDTPIPGGIPEPPLDDDDDDDPALYNPAQPASPPSQPHSPTDSKHSPSYTIVRPAEPPPRPAALYETIPSNPFSIAHATPFYGDPNDHVAKPHPFAGQIIRVRRSGADGFSPFPITFPYPLTKVEIVPRVIRPTLRPPSLAELRNSASQSSHRGSNPAPNIAFGIDSAGRQVQQPRHAGVRDTLTMSPDPAADFVPASFDVEQLAPLFQLSSESSDTEPQCTPRAAEVGDPAGEEAGENALVQNRPLSPKYDEGFQQRFVPPSRQVLETPKSKRLDSASKRTANSSTRSSKFTRNSTVSLSESQHRYQNLTVMSIEILAESFADRLPDPAQNAILAACTVVQKDYASCDGQGNTTVLFAVDPGTLPKAAKGMTLLTYESETVLLDALTMHIRQEDPDVLMGYETQQGSVGYILERCLTINHSFSQSASRWIKGTAFEGNARPAQSSNSAAAAYYQRKGADIKITGRHVLSLWRIVRKEVKLSAYSREAVASELFQTTFPKHDNRDMEAWFRSSRNSPRALQHLARIALLNIAIQDKLSILSRTGELARVFGVDFMSVLTRGSQFRVESMMGRVARARGFLLLSAPREQVFQQPAVEALPLVMEPQSALYVDPVIVLDFQSLYPSVIIAHNLCFSTMLGNVNRISSWSEGRRVGVVPNYVPPVSEHGPALSAENIYVSSSGEMFVDASIRRGILPQLLEEILETRVMVKKAMKEIVGDEATIGLLNARQFGLKMIANVTYGYTAASFSGRMPCAGLADAIVQCGRDSLEEIIRYVEEELRPETGATVVYGDTDSLFVQVPGASREEAFTIGERIVAQAADIFPDPITLKLEKVYQPCVLQTKKRYVGYSYESRDQTIPIFDAKGIETVRRDSCPLVQKSLERSIRVLFETKDVSLVKKYVQRLCQKLHLDRIPFSDYIFRKEVRLGSYKEGHLPPAAIVATKAIERDPRAAPRHGERVPFVVLYDRPGAPLKDCVVSPEEYLDAARLGLARLNTTYYITKQVLPALDRIFSLIGVRVGGWYAEVPRHVYDPILPVRKSERKRSWSKQSSLHMYYTTEKCAVCHGKGVERQVCQKCIADPASLQATRFLLATRAREQERFRAELVGRCFACVSDRADDANDVRCHNLICSVHDELAVSTKKLSILQNVLSDGSIWTP